MCQNSAHKIQSTRMPLKMQFVNNKHIGIRKAFRSVFCLFLTFMKMKLSGFMRCRQYKIWKTKLNCCKTKPKQNQTKAEHYDYMNMITEVPH